MTTFKLGLRKDATWHDQNHYPIYEEDTEREIVFADGHKYAIILPLEEFSEGLGYTSHASMEDCAKESARLSKIYIGHQIVDTDGFNYYRENDDRGELYLQVQAGRDLVFTVVQADQKVMTVLKLALWKDVAPFDQNFSTIYEKNNEREIVFADGHKYAIILPIEAFSEGVGYSTYANEDDVITESKQLSNTKTNHHIIDTDGMSYMRVDATMSDVYLHKVKTRVVLLASDIKSK